MDFLTKEDFRTLIETHGEWCVSLFMPAVRAGIETQQNPIRFKNLLRGAEERLVGAGLRPQDAAALLKPAQDLLNDAGFWREPGDGLAVFLAPDTLYTYWLPSRFDDVVVVTQRFHVKPLLPLLSGDGRFYLLALSQDRLRLWEGTRHSLSEVDLVGVPGSLDEALQMDRAERQLRAVGASGSAVFHGYGAGSEDETKLNLLRFFHMVDRGICSYIPDKRVPLVLAGVDYLLPIYHETNEYPMLLAEGITGSPEALSVKELHQRAWALVEPHFTKAYADQVALYAQHAGRGEELVSNKLKKILVAAHQGRIATLFVALNVSRWGVYEPDTFAMQAHPEFQPGDQDLLDLAAAQTYLSGGAVYAVREEDVPGGGPVAAIFRY